MNVWAVGKENQIGTYKPFGINVPIHAVQFHPNESILAVSTFGKKLPILLYQQCNAPKETIINLKIDETEYINRILQVEEPPSKKLVKNIESDQSNKHFRDILTKIDKLIM